MAREAILQISAMPRPDFIAIAKEPFCIQPADWSFDAYHGAAAVQEDKGLNKMIYCLVPRKMEETDFWRLYFSKVNYIIDSVKTHGTYPPPAPKPAPPAAKAAAASKPTAAAADDGSSCLLQ